MKMNKDKIFQTIFTVLMCGNALVLFHSFFLIFKTNSLFFSVSFFIGIIFLIFLILIAVVYCTSTKSLFFDASTGLFWRRKTNQFDASMYEASVVVYFTKSFKFRESNVNKIDKILSQNYYSKNSRRIFLGYRKDYIDIANSYQRVMCHTYLENMKLDFWIVNALSHSKNWKHGFQYLIRVNDLEIFDQVLNENEQVTAVHFILDDNIHLDKDEEYHWCCTNNKNIVAKFKFFDVIIIDFKSLNEYLNDLITTKL
jgi:hypothetical protein